MTKPVDFSPLPDPIPKCCGDVTEYQAVPSVRILEEGGTEEGYALESPSCGCRDRWVTHRWSKGHAEFVKVGEAAAAFRREFVKGA